MTDIPSEPTDETLCEWAADLWQLKGARYRMGRYGEGVALMADFADGTMRCMAGIDHPDGRKWIALILRSDSIAKDVARISRMPPMMLDPPKPSRPRPAPVPQPYLQSPSAAPPVSDDLAEALSFVHAPSSHPPASTSTDDHHQHSDSPAPSLDAGGGSTSGAGASGDWAGSSSSSDSGSSDSGSSDSGGGGTD